MIFLESLRFARILDDAMRKRTKKELEFRDIKKDKKGKWKPYDTPLPENLRRLYAVIRFWQERLRTDKLNAEEKIELEDFIRVAEDLFKIELREEYGITPNTAAIAVGPGGILYRTFSE